MVSESSLKPFIFVLTSIYTEKRKNRNGRKVNWLGTQSRFRRRNQVMSRARARK